MKKKIIFVGSSDTEDIIKSSNIKNYEIFGYTGLEKRKSKKKFIQNNNLKKYRGYYLINNIFNNIDRNKFYIKNKNRFKFIGLVHQSAQIFETSKLGNQVIIFPNVIISSNSNIGAGNIISYNSLIGHDVHLGKYNYICPSCNILADVKIGSYCLIGSNVTILPGIKVPNYSSIPAGSIVSKDPKRNSIFNHSSKINFKN